MEKIDASLRCNYHPVRRIDSCDNIRSYNLIQQDISRNKSESPEPSRNNNYYLHYIHNINNLNNEINGNIFIINIILIIIVIKIIIIIIIYTMKIIIVV